MLQLDDDDTEGRVAAVAREADYAVRMANDVALAPAEPGVAATLGNLPKLERVLLLVLACTAALDPQTVALTVEFAQRAALSVLAIENEAGDLLAAIAPAVGLGVLAETARALVPALKGLRSAVLQCAGFPAPADWPRARRCDE